MLAFGLRSASTRVLPPGAAQQSRYLFPSTHEKRYELRDLVLNGNATLAKGWGLSHIAGVDNPGRSQQPARANFDSITFQFVFNRVININGVTPGAIPQPNAGLRRLLIIDTNLPSSLVAKLADPAFDQPQRMRGRLRQFLIRLGSCNLTPDYRMSRRSVFNACRVRHSASCTGEDVRPTSASLRSTALANGAAERLRARFTKSTLS